MVIDVRYGWKANLAMAPNGTAQTGNGKYVVVWRKIGSEWKVAADIFNSDLPACGG
jgi:ketosteroid isomerase-like protein